MAPVSFNEPVGRGSIGSRSLRRGRAADRRGFRADEGPRGPNSCAGAASPARGRRPNRPPVRSVEQAQPSDGVEGQARRARPARRGLRPAVSSDSVTDSASRVSGVRPIIISGVRPIIKLLARTLSNPSPATHDRRPIDSKSGRVASTHRAPASGSSHWGHRSGESNEGSTSERARRQDSSRLLAGFFAESEIGTSQESQVRRHWRRSCP